MGVVIANDVLLDIGLALLEPLTNTTLGTAIVAGVRTVTPTSMVGIFAGAILAVGANGSGTQEAVTVSSTTASTFTATFVNDHPNTDPVTGMTFSSGGSTSPLFSQAEVLGYMTDAQRDFILQVRPIYAVGTVNLLAGKRIYSAPSDSVRVERCSIVNAGANPPTAKSLYSSSQVDLDLMVYGWQSAQGPSSWYQDQINTQTFGLGPTPQVGGPLTVMYSQCPTTSLGILSSFVIPDPMTVAVKWRTLAVCFSKDGEQRDPRRAAFAQQLYDMIVMASKKFMCGVLARVRSEDETVEQLASQRM